MAFFGFIEKEWQALLERRIEGRSAILYSELLKEFENFEFGKGNKYADMIDRDQLSDYLIEQTRKLGYKTLVVPGENGFEEYAIVKPKKLTAVRRVLEDIYGPLLESFEQKSEMIKVASQG